MTTAARKVHRLAWATLVYTVGVILWGAYVRASSSGDGCGDHWPMCRGQIVPHDPAVATLIELTHRVTSGLAWVVAAALAVAAWRAFPPRHRARRAGVAVLVLMTTEALIGAGVVLLRMVGDNASVARAAWMAGHLINTFLLVGALTLTVRWSGEPDRRGGRHSGLLLLCLGGLIVVGMGGAIAALGDTLFPAASLAQGFESDLSPAAHLFVRLRVFHPLMAVGVGALILFAAAQLWVTHSDGAVRRSAVVAGLLVAVQLGLGGINILLLTPVWMQIVHLLFAHLTWIAVVWLEDAARPVISLQSIPAPLPAGSAPSSAAAPSGLPETAPTARRAAPR